jgi:uncharacterized protein YraI
MLKNMLKTTVLTTALLVPGVATAAVGAIVTTDLNIRTGPSTSYQRFATIPDGGRVTVHGCRQAYNWCDVSWHGDRGWVSGNYLAYRQGRRIPDVGFEIDLPIIDFQVGAYHDRHYRGRPWYRGPGRWDRGDHADNRDRGRWDRDRGRGNGRANARDERRDVQEARRDVREARRDLRRERRRGGNVRDEQRELIMAQRELRREIRDLRRARR